MRVLFSRRGNVAGVAAFLFGLRDAGVARGLLVVVGGGWFPATSTSMNRPPPPAPPGMYFRFLYSGPSEAGPDEVTAGLGEAAFAGVGVLGAARLARAARGLTRGALALRVRPRRLDPVDWRCRDAKGFGAMANVCGDVGFGFECVFLDARARSRRDKSYVSGPVRVRVVM
jgi:hypothetical protein